MIPILSLSEMRAADAKAVAARGQDALVRDAGNGGGALARNDCSDGATRGASASSRDLDSTGPTVEWPHDG